MFDIICTIFKTNGIVPKKVRSFFYCFKNKFLINSSCVGCQKNTRGTQEVHSDRLKYSFTKKYTPGRKKCVFFYKSIYEKLFSNQILC